ncbi:Cupin family protein [Cyanobium sp. PCC 7001]|nr:Cupin family protein [Cyanobium sp. PCC 7001]
MMACWPDPDHASAEELVDQLQLAPHPEGGWYRELHRSVAQVRREDGELRSALTHIVYLLAAGGLSRWHRVRGSDELWQFVAGDPLELWTLPPEGGEAQAHCLAPPALAHAGAQGGGDDGVADAGSGAIASVHVVPAGWWQAARAPGRWTLVSCVVAPGFAFEDFDLLRELPAWQHPPGAVAALL